MPNRKLFLESIFGQQNLKLNEVYQVKLLENKVAIFDGKTITFVNL